MNSRLLVGAGVAVAFYFTSSPIRAQGQIADAIYSDVKDVVEELLTAEIAESIVPELICQAGRARVPDGTCNETGPGQCDRYVVPLVREGGDQQFRLLLLQNFPASLQRVYSRQFGSLRPALIDESADFAGYAVYQSITALQVNVVGPVTAEQLTGVAPKTVGVEKTDDGSAWFAPLERTANEKCVELVKGRFKAGRFESKQASPLDDACRVEPLAENQDGARSSHSYACETAFAVRAAVQGKTSIAQEHVIGVLGALLGDVAVGQIAKLEKQVNAKLTAGQKRRIERKVRDGALLAVRELLSAPSAPALPLAAQFEKLLTDAVCSGNVSNLCAPGAIAPLIATLDQIASDLRNEWQLVTAGGTKIVDVATFVDVLTGSASAVSALCGSGNLLDPAARPVCDMMSRAASVMGRANALWPIVHAAGRGDTREVAHLAISGMFHLGGGADEETKNQLYRRFADSIAMYTIDVAEGQSPSVGTREAFKSAAVDVIRSISGPSGFSRGWAWNFLTPSFGLRASWNPAYVNKNGDNLRYVASANWLRLRIHPFRYTNLTYLALEASAVDFVAPLSELALRDNQNADYDHKARVASNVVSPRIDLLLGIPSLSQHFAVGVGGSVRLVAPSRTSRTIVDGVTRSKYDYEYVGGDLGRFFEFGFFARYLP